MLGRHVKPGNGRKKEEDSVAAPASPPVGYKEPGGWERGGGDTTRKGQARCEAKGEGGEVSSCEFI